MSGRTHEQVRADLADNERQIAYLTGKIEATVEGLRHDPELVALVEREAARRGVELSALMDETMERIRARHLPAPLTPGPIDEEPGSVDPAVAKFRELLS